MGLPLAPEVQWARKGYGPNPPFLAHITAKFVFSNLTICVLGALNKKENNRLTGFEHAHRHLKEPLIGPVGGAGCLRPMPQK